MQDRWKEIEEIFHTAAAVYGAEREAVLNVACDGDKFLHSELNGLLAEHDAESTSLDDTVFETGLQILDAEVIGGRTGETLGPYRFGRMIGRGGMGDVYAAEDTGLGRTVAIKLVNELFALDPERIRRFRKEANAASRVSHPNVAKLYELCEIGGENIIVMEYVEGANLRHYLADPIPPERALEIAIQIASALAASHAVGVVHRDIKPENIVIGPDWRVKVLDFGLAKLIEPIGEGAIQIPGGKRIDLTVDMSTELGALIGTPAYMSPEQIRGADVDAQTDIWSLGVLLYETFSGRMPFRGATKIDLIAAILTSEPVPLREHGFAHHDLVDSVLRRILSKEKSGRFQTAGELLAELDKIKQRFTPLGDERSRLTSHGKRTFRKSLVILGIPIILIALFFGRGYFVQASIPASGLVGDWQANNNAKDILELNDGTLMNGATFAEGEHDQAFSFDGANGYVEVPDSPSLSITGPLTLQASVKLDTNTVPQSIIEKYDTPGANGYVLRLNAVGKLEAAVCNRITCGRAAATGETTVSTGIWHRVAAVYDGNDIRLYLDGILDTTFHTDLAPTDGVSSLKIGARGDDADWRFNGLIDDVKIYNRALSYSEISQITGLVSYWPGDGNTYDVVGKNTGQLFGGATYRPGVSGQAFSFSTVDGYFQAPTSGLPPGSSDRTVSMWVKMDTVETPQSFFGGYGRFGSLGQTYALVTTIEGRDVAITNWGEGPGLTTLDPGKWYHIVATSDAISTSLYVNGTLIKPQQMKLDTPADTYFYSGRMPGDLGNTSRLKGAVDEIQIYDRSLSPTEIHNLFLANKPPDG